MTPRALGKAAIKKLDALRNDRRAHAAYWNCDDWGSISGYRDAQEWVESEFGKWVLEQAEDAK